MNSNNIFEERARLKSKTIEKPEEKKEIPQKEDIFAQRAKLKEQNPEEISSIFGVPFKDIARQGAQYTARGIEGAAGIPGNIYQAAKTLSEYFPNLPSFLQREENFIQKGAKKIGENLPTTRQIREGIKEATSGFLEPQSESESFFGDIIEDAASLRGAGFTGLRSIGTAILGNATKPIVEEFGGGKTEQEIAKAGVMFISALTNPGGAREYGQQRFRQAINDIPPNATMATNRMQRETQNFLRDIRVGGMSPQKQHAYNLAQQFETAIANPQVNVRELPAFRQSLNDFRFNRELNPTAHHWLDRFDQILNRNLNIYGRTNPAFLANYREGNQVLSSLHEGSRIARYIRRVTGAKELRPETLALFTHLNPTTMKIAAGAEATAQTFSFFNRFANNPAFRRYYLQTLRNAARSNAPGVIKNIEKLDKTIKEEKESD